MKEIKDNVRAYIKYIRSNMKQEDVSFRSYGIYKSLINIINFKKLHTIAVYLDFDNEVATFLFIMHCLENNIDVVVPKIYGDDIKFKYISNPQGKKIDIQFYEKFYDNLKNNAFKIPEPKDNAKECPIDDIEIFITPAIAFDERGTRLGYGKGYYDKVFAKNKNALRIGIAYSFQVLPLIPTSEHDENVDFIVTEHNVIIPSENNIF